MSNKTPVGSLWKMIGLEDSPTFKVIKSKRKFVTYVDVEKLDQAGTERDRESFEREFVRKK